MALCGRENGSREAAASSESGSPCGALWTRGQTRAQPLVAKASRLVDAENRPAQQSLVARADRLDESRTDPRTASGGAVARLMATRTDPHNIREWRNRAALVLCGIEDRPAQQPRVEKAGRLLVLCGIEDRSAQQLRWRSGTSHGYGDRLV